MIDPCTIADTIRTECERQGRSLRDVCRSAGVSHGIVIRWGGTATEEPSLPSLRVLALVCDELKLSPGAVVTIAESKG